jgi:Calcium-activated chloride channel
VTNIGPWLSIAEFMAFAAVVSNCLLLYFSTNSLFNWLKSHLAELNPLALEDTSAETYRTFLYLLWIIVGVEHIIVLVKQLTSELVPDVPGWVEKAQLRVERQQNELQLREQDRDMQRKQQAAETAMQRIREMQIKREQMLSEIQKEIQRLRDTVDTRQEEIERLRTQQAKMQEELRIAQVQS